jgi:peptidoglycan hydrolase CwlO-like protein
LEEVDKYKDQLEQGLRDAERRHAAIALRQMQDKDKVITNLHTQKTNMENEVARLEAEIQEKEGVIEGQQKSIEALKNEVGLKEKKCAEYETRFEVAAKYMENSKKE